MLVLILTSSISRLLGLWSRWLSQLTGSCTLRRMGIPCSLLFGWVIIDWLIVHSSYTLVFLFLSFPVYRLKFKIVVWEELILNGSALVEGLSSQWWL
jgi:hypothetical protein